MMTDECPLCGRGYEPGVGGNEGELTLRNVAKGERSGKVQRGNESVKDCDFAVE